MEVDRTHTQETSRNHHLSSITWNPQVRSEEAGLETPGKEMKKGKQKRWATPGEMERMATDRKQWRSLFDGLRSQRANWHK